jgi:hypothetical protein
MVTGTITTAAAGMYPALNLSFKASFDASGRGREES